MIINVLKMLNFNRVIFTRIDFLEKYHAIESLYTLDDEQFSIIMGIRNHKLFAVTQHDDIPIFIFYKFTNAMNSNQIIRLKLDSN